MEFVRGSEWNRWDIHLHTASSYDAKYKGSDFDELLCDTLRSNDIKAVAITDHFKIDKERIVHLRSIAPDIVFFPGVELRTDKNANNLHVILIFNNDNPLPDLVEDFNAIMIRQKAKAKENNETIYWDFTDIVEFAKEHDALISVHAGRKTNGIDKELPNAKALPYQFAAKDEIGKIVDFFEVGQKRDIDDYREHVLPSVGEKPIIMCSDCHDPRNYEPKEYLWIKGNITFDGLKQSLCQPKERVYVGTIPPALERVQKNKQVNINSIAVHRIDSCVHKDIKWFDFEIPMNSGLVAIIGNKGSGKSALSDIIGHLCKCSTMSHASFLNADRFRKSPKNYANDYKGTITWADGHSESTGLGESYYDSTIEDAQYLPQSYIEEICNDIGDVFQREIDKVIFSYVDRTERADATNLSELVEIKSKSLLTELSSLMELIHQVNTRIIKLEDKRTIAYKRSVSDGLKKMQESLQRHEKSKPELVKKPNPKDDDTAYQEKLSELNKVISSSNDVIEEKKKRQTEITTIVIEARTLLAKVKDVSADIDEINNLLGVFANKYQLERQQMVVKVSNLPENPLEEFIRRLEKEKVEIQDSIENLQDVVKKSQEEKDSLIASTNGEEKRYQQYLQNLEEWERQKIDIIGTKEQEDTLAYYECEQKYLSEFLLEEYTKEIEKRDQLTRNIYELKRNLTDIYQEIYNPVEGEISNLLGDIEDNISFQAEVRLMDMEFDENVLRYINQKYAGIFKGATQSREQMSKFVRSTEFENEDSVMNLIHNILNVVEEDIDSSNKKVSDKQSLYDYMFGLGYIGVSFKLKMGNRDLAELSPGERGIVLLIFYLALSKNKTPLIIDQPEDNLDNQSVYSKLVPCICRAKQKRQVIIVTHNPNIAVACDAEQIIYCTMDKNNFEITYDSGAIENPVIKEKVVDVLEGTLPAFNLRRYKYGE